MNPMKDILGNILQDGDNICLIHNDKVVPDPLYIITVLNREFYIREEHTPTNEKLNIEDGKFLIVNRRRK